MGSLRFILGLAAISLSSTAMAQDYRSWDRNNDGIISRAEWRGTAQEFRDRDVNRDGFLSGTELRTLDVAPGEQDGSEPSFVSLDRNGDGRINRGEWRGTRASFLRLDRNRDNFITRGEYMNAGASYDDDTVDITGLTALDVNGDGTVDRREWRGTRPAFNRLDVNNDGVLTRYELAADEAAADRADDFDLFDRNNDGVLSRGEWRGNVAIFNQYDANNDGVISRHEYGTTAATPARQQDTFTIEARQQWTDTGLSVTAGDIVTFRATGTIQMRTDENDRATPEGAISGRTARGAPMPSQKAGTLLVRIGDTIEAMGADGRFTARNTGRLYLGVNDDYMEDNRGQYRVQVTIGQR